MSFAENGNIMNSADFERLCSLICDGHKEHEDVSYHLNNKFYESFGMSYIEILGLIS